MSIAGGKSRANLIRVSGARVNNLKNIDVEIPRDRLVVVTGMSGSGKSSLAFDVIHAEGNRRYLEGMSSYARQFLDISAKADVAKIENLSPTISIDQKSVSKSPRSTVGTMTEIYDYLRLLFSKIAAPHCPKCDLPMKRVTKREILEKILEFDENTQVLIAARTTAFKENKKEILKNISQLGYARVRVSGKIMPVSEAVLVGENFSKDGEIEIVVDRLTLKKKEPDTERILDSVETAFRLGKGFLTISADNRKNFCFSRDFVCPECFFKIAEITPKNFSFNSPEGACPKCAGLGVIKKFDEDLLLPNKNLSLAEGAVIPLNKSRNGVFSGNGTIGEIFQLGKRIGFSLNDPVKKIASKKLETIFYGEKREGGFPGLMAIFKKKYREAASLGTKCELEKYMNQKTCPDCRGKRLKNEYLSARIMGKSIDDVSRMNLADFRGFLGKLLANETIAEKRKIIEPITREMEARTVSLENVGLEYLSLSRGAESLSGGEGQRIRLATQIGSDLSQIIYVLDEPSIGLHVRDTKKLILAMRKLQGEGNSLIVVEHDKDIINSADWIIDMGPGAGEDGGKIIFEGNLKKMLSRKTVTAQYLSGKKRIERKARKKDGREKFLEVFGAAERNLKNIDVKIPLGKLIAVSGVSGSGKSTLVSQILAKALSRHFFGSKNLPGRHKKIAGLQNIDKVIHIDQSPIGRTPRSNAATYTGVFSLIREVFAETPEAKNRGYGASRFSFNISPSGGGGRCEDCQGDGKKKIEMHLLPDIYVECETCRGTRYNQKTLDIEYQGASIAQILDMSVSYALKFFKKNRFIWEKLKVMEEVGLGYLKLGQSAIHLSGGEAQRIKLAAELSRRGTGKTFYILDEPTIGLHFEDVKKLLEVLSALVEKGNTVLVVEHNLDVIKNCDWVIDLGPEGGEGGGEIVYAGPPEGLKKCKRSWTGKYL